MPRKKRATKIKKSKTTKTKRVRKKETDVVKQKQNSKKQEKRSKKEDSTMYQFTPQININVEEILRAHGIKATKKAINSFLELLSEIKQLLSQNPKLILDVDRFIKLLQDTWYKETFVVFKISNNPESYLFFFETYGAIGGIMEDGIYIKLRNKQVIKYEYNDTIVNPAFLLESISKIKNPLLNINFKFQEVKIWKLKVQI